MAISHISTIKYLLRAVVVNTTHASDDVTIWDEVTKISIHAVHKTSPVAVFKAMSYKYMLHILHSDV